MAPNTPQRILNIRTRSFKPDPDDSSPDSAVRYEEILGTGVPSESWPPAKLGDVYISMSSDNVHDCALYGKGNDGWKEWQGGSPDSSPVVHPMFPECTLQAAPEQGAISWMHKSIRVVIPKSYESSAVIVAEILVSWSKTDGKPLLQETAPWNATSTFSISSSDSATMNNRRPNFHLPPDPILGDKNATFIHPPFTDYPGADRSGKPLTYSLLTENDWFLLPDDFGETDGERERPIPFPQSLQPPRGWVNETKDKNKQKQLAGVTLPQAGLPGLRCPFCRRSYYGKNASSMWRRHILSSHRIAMYNRRYMESTLAQRKSKPNTHNVNGKPKIDSESESEPGSPASPTASSSTVVPSQPEAGSSKTPYTAQPPPASQKRHIPPLTSPITTRLRKVVWDHSPGDPSLSQLAKTPNGSDRLDDPEPPFKKRIVEHETSSYPHLSTSTSTPALASSGQRRYVISEAFSGYGSGRPLATSPAISAPIAHIATPSIPHSEPSGQSTVLNPRFTRLAEHRQSSSPKGPNSTVVEDSHANRHENGTVIVKASKDSHDVDMADPGEAVLAWGLTLTARLNHLIHPPS